MPRRKRFGGGLPHRALTLLRLRRITASLSFAEGRKEWRTSARICGRELRYGRPLGLTAACLVAVMLVVQIGGAPSATKRVDALFYGPEGKPSQHRVTDAEFVGLQAERIRTHILRVPGRVDKKQLLRSYDEMAPRLRAVAGQLEANRRKLVGLDAEGALRRLATIRRSFDRGVESLHNTVAALQTGPPSRRAELARRFEAALDVVAPRPNTRALSADMPFAESNAVGRTPILSSAATPAYGAPTGGRGNASLPRDPTSDDLEASAETAAGSGVRSLADQLQHDPVKIFDYVHAHIRFDPYEGVRKGAEETLREQSGSAADQSALLVSLLRESGIPARILRGTAELPIAQAANWVGLDTERGAAPDAATQVLASSGIPVTAIRANGRVQRIRFDHFWVEAYVSSSAYRGVDEGRGHKTWIPLDASIKRTVFSAPTPGAQLISHSEAESLVAQARAAEAPQADGGLVVHDYHALRTSAESLLSERLENMDFDSLATGSAVDDAAGVAKPTARALAILPASLPFRTVAVTGEYRTLPSDLSASVELRIDGANPHSVPVGDDDEGIAYSASTSELIGKRITVTYVPASDFDASVLDAYHGLLNTPSYAASLVPVVRVDGSPVAVGSRAAAIGYTQRFRIVYRQPGFASQVVENGLTVGGITALALDGGTVTPAAIANRIDDLRHRSSVGPSGLAALTDNGAGRALSLAAATYFFQADAANRGVQGPEVFARRALSGAIAATGTKSTYIAGYPISTRLSGVEMDVDADNQVIVSAGTNPEAAERYLTVSGSLASEAEASSLDATFGGMQSVSTTRILAAAAEQGIPIYTVTQQNADEQLPRLDLSPSDATSIRAALTESERVTVPQRSTTIGTWEGTGWVAESPSGRAFSISGGLAGGSSPQDATTTTDNGTACSVSFIITALAITAAWQSEFALVGVAVAVLDSIFVGIILVLLLLVIIEAIFDKEFRAALWNVVSEAWKQANNVIKDIGSFWTHCIEGTTATDDGAPNAP